MATTSKVRVCRLNRERARPNTARVTTPQNTPGNSKQPPLGRRSQGPAEQAPTTTVPMAPSQLKRDASTKAQSQTKAQNNHASIRHWAIVRPSRLIQTN